MSKVIEKILEDVFILGAIAFKETNGNQYALQSKCDDSAKRYKPAIQQYYKDYYKALVMKELKECAVHLVHYYTRKDIDKTSADLTLRKKTTYCVGIEELTERLNKALEGK